MALDFLFDSNQGPQAAPLAASPGGALQPREAPDIPARAMAVRANAPRNRGQSALGIVSLSCIHLGQALRDRPVQGPGAARRSTTLSTIQRRSLHAL